MEFSFYFSTFLLFCIMWDSLAAAFFYCAAYFGLKLKNKALWQLNVLRLVRLDSFEQHRCSGKFHDKYTTKHSLTAMATSWIYAIPLVKGGRTCEGVLKYNQTSNCKHFHGNFIRQHEKIVCKMQNQIWIKKE